MSRTWHKLRNSRRTGSAKVDPTCRNHGTCSWCRSNRLYSTRRYLMRDDEILEDIIWTLRDLKNDKS